MQKIVISKPGFNVLTETNPNNLIFSSDYNTFKYGVSGTVTIDSSNLISLEDGIYTYRVKVDFNAGFDPAIFAYARHDTVFGSGIYLPLPYHRQTITTVADYGMYWNKDSLFLQYVSSSVISGSILMKYFIFKNDLDILP